VLTAESKVKKNVILLQHEQTISYLIVLLHIRNLIVKLYVFDIFIRVISLMEDKLIPEKEFEYEVQLKSLDI
jgi:hypothetical protein